MELRKRVKLSKPEHNLSLFQDASPPGTCSNKTWDKKRSNATHQGGKCLVSQTPKFPFLVFRKWSGRSPSGPSVDCTTPTSSKCCRPRQYRKVGFIWKRA
uniref:Uncharacterized protein n=1 Tax=Labrus bergylta TaxID=56723 RepID=A0A3Q3E9B4_9LABR